MQLTNYGLIESRGNYLATQANHERPMDRISSGLRLSSSRDDAGALSQSKRQRLEMMNDTAFRTNLQNARTFLTMQQAGLQEVRATYSRMEFLAQRGIDPTLSDVDRADNELEFRELVKQLDELMGQKFNGIRLFNQNTVCGAVKDIPLGQLDLINGKAGANHAIRAQTLDVQAPGGTLTFRVNSGGAGDLYRIFMGNQEVFSAGSSFAGPDPTLQYNDPGTFALGPDRWVTSGNARNGDADTFEVTFGPGTPTTYKVTHGGSNAGLAANNGAGAQGQLVADGGIIRTGDVPFGSTNTNLTLQIETTTIGIIYAESNPNPGDPGVKFEPMSYDSIIPLDTHDNTMLFRAKGFGTLEEHSIATFDLAKDTLDHLVGKNGYYGETKCIAEDRMPAVAAELRRIDLKLADLEDQHMNGEVALSRIQDTDVAREATSLAKQNLKMEVAANAMSRVTRLTDVLMPLATQRHGGGLMGASIL